VPLAVPDGVAHETAAGIGCAPRLSLSTTPEAQERSPARRPCSDTIVQHGVTLAEERDAVKIIFLGFFTLMTTDHHRLRRRPSSDASVARSNI
jgi:hypothetical protein